MTGLQSGEQVCGILRKTRQDGKHLLGFPLIVDTLFQCKSNFASRP